MPTVDIPDLITKIKAGKTSIEVLSSLRNTKAAEISRLHDKIRVIKERIKTFQYKVDRSDRHIADPDITHYEAYETEFLARKTADEEQVTLLTGHLTSFETKRDAELLLLKEMDEALGPMRRGIMS